MTIIRALTNLRVHATVAQRDAKADWTVTLSPYQPHS